MQIQAIRRPTSRNHNSQFRLIWNHKWQVHNEMEWIYRREDLAALARDSEHGWFNGFVKDGLHMISRKMTMVSTHLTSHTAWYLSMVYPALVTN